MTMENILEMLNAGQIEELKAILKDEIYKKEIRKNVGQKERYAAMKRYFRYALPENKTKKQFRYPCKNVKVLNNTYNSFLNGYCFALTKENTGEMTCYDNSGQDYFDIDKLVKFDGEMETIDLRKPFAEAKKQGYKYLKNEVCIHGDFKYAFKYKDSYYKSGLFDQAFGIINDGKEAELYYRGKNDILIVKTSIGIAGILPFKPVGNIEERKIVISIE